MKHRAPPLHPFRALSLGAMAALVLFLSVHPAAATQVRSLSLEQLTNKAGRIVAGRCTRVEVIHDSATGRPITAVTITIDRTLKGRQEGVITFRMTGPSRGARTAGLPAFSPGEEVVLFLYPESRSGHTSPVGLGQGKFVVQHGKDGGKIARNLHGNRRLFLGLSAGAGARIEPLRRGRATDGPLHRETLLEMIQGLVAAGAGP